MDKNRKYRVFISAAEPSADAHCANLISAFSKSGYDNIEIVGVGGPKMAEAGCKLLQATVGKAAMLYNAFTQVRYYYKLLKRIKRYFKDNKVDLVVVCDSPAFNWHVAKCAKKAGIKTLFYVAPQLWAWAGWRIRKLRKRCDKLCCLLPFEEDWFSKRGIDVDFVGNPMLDAMEIEWGRRKQYADFDRNKVRLALMPGSRQAELKALWRPMQEIALRIKGKYPGATFVTVAVDARRQKALDEKKIPGFECDYTIGSVSETADAVDFAIVASGSATLQVAAVGCPMVVMYQSSRILWYLVGWWVIKTKYLSLVNILAERELVPEFMPYFTSIEPIAESIERLLADRDKLAEISGALTELTKPLGEKKAGQEVARVVVEMLA
ncbi:MAG: lipid-A-disaccharide synthase [Planctomycetes bacterium]|nr:lipid-A-disaccharide synthase [Planctomycetota bacterium]